MNKIKNIYEKNILSINNSISIYQYLQSQAKNLDATILLRSQFVLIVSAFDTYVHSAVINKIIDRYFSSDQQLNIQLDIPLSLAYEMKNLNVDMQKNKLYNFLVRKLNKDSFQSPKSIEYAFSIIGINKIWTRLSDKMQMQPDDIKKMLSIIVNRRNKIAHESDWNIVTGTYEDIELTDVLECKKFINNMVDSIDDIVYCGNILATENQ